MSETAGGEINYGTTAAKILATARRLFMQRGYRAVSINDIVQVAEITKPTLYYHFADKEELYVQMALHTLAEMHAGMDHALAAGQTTAARLTALAGAIMHAADGDTRMMRHEIREHLTPAQQLRISQAFERHIVDPLRRVMADGIARGDLAGHTADELAWLFLSLIEGFHREPGTASLPPGVPAGATFSTETLVHLFLYGVSARSA